MFHELSSGIIRSPRALLCCRSIGWIALSKRHTSNCTGHTSPFDTMLICADLRIHITFNQMRYQFKCTPQCRWSSTFVMLTYSHACHARQLVCLPDPLAPFRMIPTISYRGYQCGALWSLVVALIVIITLAHPAQAATYLTLAPGNFSEYVNGSVPAIVEFFYPG